MYLFKVRALVVSKAIATTVTCMRLFTCNIYTCVYSHACRLDIAPQFYDSTYFILDAGTLYLGTEAKIVFHETIFLVQAERFAYKYVTVSERITLDRGYPCMHGFCRKDPG